MRRFLDRLYLVSGWAGAVCIALICLLVVSQVFLNLLDRLSSLITGSAIGLTIPSYSDFTGFLLVGASFLALAHTLREGAHIRVVLLIGRLPSAMQKTVEKWCVGFGLAVTLYFTWYTAGLTCESYRYNDLSPGMIPVPIWIPQMAMLFGLFVLAVTLTDELVSIFKGRPPSYEQNRENLLPDKKRTLESDDTGEATR
jgi:TRAP-type C4-dicarboxylate transport system permease small subunit